MKSLNRHQYKWKDQSGFTLMELIVSAAISIMVLGMVAQVFTQQRAAFTNQTNMAKMVANGRGAVEFVTRAIQNAGYHVIRGGKILSGSDHYITTVSDLDDDGVVEANEVLTYVVSSVGGTNNRTLTFPAFFDMNGDGQLISSETRTYTINYSLTGPPFNLLQFTPKADGTVESFVVAENIDNLIFRFYDPSGIEMGVSAVDGSVPTKTDGLNDLPVRIEAADLPNVRTVNMEYMVRTKDEDENPKFTNSAPYLAGSAATQLTGSPQPTAASYTDSFRRRTMTAQASPRNLGLAPFGRITLQPSNNPVTCPETSTPFTVTAVDSAGSPIDNWNVNLRVNNAGTVALSTSAVTTDSQGEASGSISFDWSVPNITATMSADAQWTDLDGTLRSVITSVPVSFVSPSGAGVFDDFNDGDADGWVETNPSEWEIENQEYKLVDQPTGTVTGINPVIQGETTGTADEISIASYSITSGVSGTSKLVVGVGAEASISGGTPSVRSQQEFSNGGGSSITFTTGNYTVPNPTATGNTLKLVVVVSTEDNGNIDLTASEVRFGGSGGTVMTKVIGEQVGTGAKAATSMFYLDVNGGETGTIWVQWLEMQSHQVVTVVTLENVQPGDPEVAGVSFENAGGGVSNGTMTTVSDDTLLVIGGTSGNGNTMTPVGTGHSIHSNNNASDGGTMQGALGTVLVATAGTVNGLGMTSSSPRRVAVVIAGFAGSASGTVKPDYVRFQGNDMNEVASSEFLSGTNVTGTTLYELDVNNGDTGTILVKWPSDTSERMVSAITLNDVAAGPIVPAQTGSASNENNGATVIPDIPTTQGSLGVSFGFQNHTANVVQMGANHNLPVNQQTVNPTSLTWGGMGTVSVLADGNLSGYGYSGNHTRRAAVMANFGPAAVSTADQFTSTGCQPWSDIDVLVKMKNKGNVSAPRQAGVVVRNVDINNYYFVQLQHDGSGDPIKYNLSLIKNDGGTITTVAGPTPVDFNVSTVGTPVDYYLRIRVVGEDFKIRWWLPADPLDPTNDETATAWQIEVTDAGTAVTSGVLGLVTNRSEFSFDNVSAGPPV